MQCLYETVKEILNTGRVGVPVFMRCVAQIAPESGHIGYVLVRMLTMACSWLEASPLKVYAQSRNNSRQITVTTQYAGGQTSIVSVDAVPSVSTRVDLMLLGNKGALYHDGEALSPGFDITAEPLPVPEWLTDAVERSLRSGKPAVIKEAIGLE